MKTPNGETLSDYDSFIDGTTLNYEDLGSYCIVAYAKSLAEQPIIIENSQTIIEM